MCAGFRCKAGVRLWTLVASSADHLDGDEPVQACVARTVDVTHSAAADLLRDDVWTDLFTDLEPHQ